MLYSDSGRPGMATRFVIGLFLLKHIYGLSDEGACERWVYDPYFQHFTGEEFFQHEFPHERSDLSHWRKRLSAPSRSTDGLGVFVEMQTDCTYRHQTVRCGTA